MNNRCLPGVESTQSRLALCQSRLEGKKKTGALLNDPILTRDSAMNVDDIISIYRDETICNPISQPSNEHGNILCLLWFIRRGNGCTLSNDLRRID